VATARSILFTTLVAGCLASCLSVPKRGTLDLGSIPLPEGLVDSLDAADLFYADDPASDVIDYGDASGDAFLVEIASGDVDSGGADVKDGVDTPSPGSLRVLAVPGGAFAETGGTLMFLHFGPGLVRVYSPPVSADDALSRAGPQHTR